MGSVYDGLDHQLIDFIKAQHLFFVGSAPLARDGHINVSPKGLDSLRIIDPKTIAYVDLTGSGIETVAHVRENGRILLMFCAFEGAPKILRLHGKGEVVEPGHPRFQSLIELFPPFESSRAVILIALDRISDSCGYGIPLYRYEAERTQLAAWAERKGPEGVIEYRAQNNRVSIDGLPGLAPEPPAGET